MRKFFMNERVAFQVTGLLLAMCLFACFNPSSLECATSDPVVTITPNVKSLFLLELRVTWNALPGASRYAISVKMPNGLIYAQTSLGTNTSYSNLIGNTGVWEYTVIAYKNRNGTDYGLGQTNLRYTVPPIPYVQGQASLPTIHSN